jgi:DNA-binding transcriptional LysR family regulator
MNLDALRCLVEVAREQRFAAVARRRNVDPSNISRTVAQLESHLGVRLFQRSTRKMVLTEAGEQFLQKIEPLIDELDRAMDAARDAAAAPNGTLRLTASVTFGHERIVPLLPEFRRHYPRVQIDGIFTDENVDLVAQRIDLAVRLGSTVTGDMVVTKLVDTRYRVVASAAYLKGANRLRSPADLAMHECLLFPVQVLPPLWQFRNARGEATKVAVRGEITLSTAQALRDAAIAGLGPALLADWLVDEAIADGLLLDVFPQLQVTATTFDTAAWLVYPSRTYLPAKVRVMIDFLKEKLNPVRKTKPRIRAIR